jgi:hypothetical protein
VTGPDATTNDPANADWISTILDGLDGIIATVRAATTDRLRTAARVVVLAIMAFGLALVAMFSLVIALVRLLNWVLPVWGSYLLLGAIFCAVGLFAWSRRHRSA